MWRVLEHTYVEEGGVPVEMHAIVELEVGSAVFGAFTFVEPGCTRGTLSDDPKVVGGLTCYYAGGGEYVEVRETSPNEYIMTMFEQSEGYSDEPAVRGGEHKVGAFRAARPPLEEVLVARDGGTYSAY